MILIRTKFDDVLNFISNDVNKLIKSIEFNFQQLYEQLDKLKIRKIKVLNFKIHELLLNRKKLTY